MRRNTSDLAQSGGRNGYSKSGWLEDLGETHIVCVPRLCIREAGDFVLFLNTLLATPVTRSFSVLFFFWSLFSDWRNASINRDSHLQGSS